MTLQVHREFVPDLAEGGRGSLSAPAEDLAVDQALADQWTPERRKVSSAPVLPGSGMCRPRARAPWLALLRLAGVALALGTLWWTFRDVDSGLVKRLLLAIGPVVLVAYLPQALWIGSETAGWRWAFSLLGRPVQFLPLLRVRLSTEAIAMTLPGGNVWCESLTPILLRRHCGVPTAEGVAGFAARRYFVLLGQGLFVLCVAVFGMAYFERASIPLLGVPGLQWMVFLVGVSFFVLAYGVKVALHRGGVVERLHRLLRAFPAHRWRSFLDRKRGGFLETDGQLGRFFGGPKRVLLAPTGFFAMAWLLEALEAYLFFRLLGLELDFIAVATIEVTVVFAKHVLFISPAGLGIQEAGYVAFLTAMRVPNPVAVAAAFAVIKRSKEALWSLVGYSLLLCGRSPGLQSA